MDTRDGSDDCAVSTVVGRVTAAKRAKALWGVKSRFPPTSPLRLVDGMRTGFAMFIWENVNLDLVW